MHFKSSRLVPLLALSFCIPVLAQQKQIETSGKTPLEMNFPSSGELRMDLCPSGVVLKGTEDDKVRVSYEANRGSDADHVRVGLRASGNSGRIEISGCPHNNFRITVEVPHKTNLYVRMMAGQLDIRGIKGNKDLELHFGQLNVAIGRVSDYAHAEGSVNSGQVDAPAFKVSKGGLFRSFSQDGPGRYQLRAHVGAGQLSLTDSDD